MGQKFSTEPSSASPGGGDHYEIDPVRARSVIRAAAERALEFDDPIRETNGVDAPADVPPLVAGAVEGFFEERREALRGIKDRALAVADGAQRAVAAYDAGDEEMARATSSLAARSGALPADGPGGDT